jgi:hypothetical protein
MLPLEIQVMSLVAACAGELESPEKIKSAATASETPRREKSDNAFVVLFGSGRGLLLRKPCLIERDILPPGLWAVDQP